jgi:epsilon-lactone hydrolase
MGPSPEHEQFVSALAAGGSALTPTSLPNCDALQEMRTFEATAGFTVPEGTTVVNRRYGGVDCLCLDADNRGRTAIYFHGGGYVYTRAADALGAIAALAKRCGLQMVAPDYRRAPEFPFPAAVDDAVAVYRALLDDGVPNTDIVVAGDSAGAGLALACMLAARRRGLPAPAGGILFSPWTDLAVEGPSADAADDPVVNGAGLRVMADAYLDGANAREPLASPLYASDDELAALPPLLIQVGTRESLLDDSRRFVARAKASGVDVDYIEYPGVIHMWMVMAPELPESRQAFDAAVDFLRHLARWNALANESISPTISVTPRCRCPIERTARNPSSQTSPPGISASVQPPCD